MQHLDPPEIVEKPKDVAVRSGGTAAFYCRARGEPTPQLSWRKNGRKVIEPYRHPIYPFQRLTVVCVLFYGPLLANGIDKHGLLCKLDLWSTIDTVFDLLRTLTTFCTGPFIY